ncbi:hypothetical protein SAMN00790413_03060 [Deinococcus hopiensis KR-140]|uniref:Uncharacterized protein n=1 Tax=Deinococcus hopiensis KR-140 TaxID=695939 RepID=A0A1W1VRC3_9DEIO|nr:hypothetical protein SAMN00790413_03060 [Deinococcus hopiensis KR-140]
MAVRRSDRRIAEGQLLLLTLCPGGTRTIQSLKGQGNPVKICPLTRSPAAEQPHDSGPAIMFSA